MVAALLFADDGVVVATVGVVIVDVVAISGAAVIILAVIATCFLCVLGVGITTAADWIAVVVVGGVRTVLIDLQRGISPQIATTLTTIFR